MAMPPDKVSATHVRNQFDAGVEELERDASEGRYNTLCIRALGSAARVLGQHNAADRAARLLARCTRCGILGRGDNKCRTPGDSPRTDANG